MTISIRNSHFLKYFCQKIQTPGPGMNAGDQFKIIVSALAKMCFCKMALAKARWIFVHTFPGMNARATQKR